jgi:hypothetical protein
LEFLKASIADLTTLFFCHYKTLKAVATATAAIVVLTPANFYHFLRSKFNFQPLSFIFETLAKNLQKQKSLLRSMGRKSKQKNGKKAFKSVAMKRQQFLPKFVNNGKSRRFFDRC